MVDAVSFDDIIERRHIVVCCGTGGVGKTTAAAVFAVEGARRGRNAVVVTIDPAKRLANTLGLDSLSDTPHVIERHRWDRGGEAPPGGRLSALMLDTKSTFDHLVVKHAADDEQAQRILANTFYRNVSTALSGTQEYMAMEKLYELHEEGGYDLIVVDTPPTRHALDFLDAPKRLARLLDNRIFRLLMMPTRAYLKAVGAGVQAFLRTVSKVVGSEVINDVVAFFRAFEGMEEGFRDRATEVLALLADPSSSFVLVTSPRRDAVEEATYFTERLAESDIPVEGLVVNRVHPSFGDERVEGLRARAETLATKAVDAATPTVEGDGAASAERLAGLYANLADFRHVADGERHHVAGVKARAGRAAVAFVPFLARDVYDFEALGEVGRHVFRAAPDSFATP
ncbi:MAG TPA: ArsA family ATPase [Acidimicrobiia bacterium]|nr:ArsA family ATPase [Acidimicrobiia bacterium]